MMGLPLLYVHTDLLGFQRYIHKAYKQLFNFGSSPGKYELPCGSDGVSLSFHLSFAQQTSGVIPPASTSTTSIPLPDPYSVTAGLCIHICNLFLFSCCLRVHNPIALRKEES